MKRLYVFFVCCLLATSVFVNPQLDQSQSPLLLGGSERLEAPFEEGETLAYEVNWKPVFFFPAFKAGEIKLTVGDSERDGRPIYRIQAWAESGGSLTQVAGIRIKNYFESEIDRFSFRSYRILQQTRQGKRERDLELLFDYEKNTTSIRETDPSASPPRVLRNLVKKGIPSPAIDVLSVFYVTRLRPISVGSTFRIHLNEKGDFREVKVVALEEEEVHTPVGAFPSLKLSSTGGILSGGGDFRVWFSLDALRIPTQFEADAKLGKVYGKLIRLETPRLQKRVIQIP